MKNYALVLLSLLLTAPSYGVLQFDDATHPELITSGRALALGNSYLNKVDDSWSAFYNPAGLGTVRRLMFQPANFHIEMNSGLTFLATGSGAFDPSALSDGSTPTGLKDKWQSFPGYLSYSRQQAFPNITYRGITIGYVHSEQIMGYKAAAGEPTQLAGRKDTGPLFALNLSLFGGVLKFGASAVHLQRQQYQKDIADGDAIQVSTDNDIYEGKMMYVTVGTRLTLPIATLPSFAMVVRNSSNGSFYDAKKAGAPADIPQTVDASFSITPNMGRTSRIHLELTARDVGGIYEDIDQSKKYQFGLEFDWQRMMFFRAGYANDTWSGGIGVRARSFVFDLTSYGFIRDLAGMVVPEDRRTVLSISQGF